MTDRRLAEGPAEGHATGLEAVLDYFVERDVHCTVVPHSQTATARAEARASAVDPHEMAKTVVLVDDSDRFLLAVLPATERVDVDKVRGVKRHGHGGVRLATEGEIAMRFPHYEVGAVPPIGPDLVPEIVDQRLVEHDRLLCSGGDHEHAILITTTDLLAMAKPVVADICEDVPARGWG